MADSTLTRARGRSRAPSSTLTRARGRAVLLPSSTLTRARGRASGTVLVDAGQVQTLEPFQLAQLVMTVLTPGETADSSTWTQIAGAPEVTLTPLGLGATYETPATVAGTVLTFRVAAHKAGQPDAVDTVVHTIRPHGGEWLAIGPNQFLPVYEVFDLGVTPVSGLGVSPLGTSPLGV